jgi:prepilin-type N-terminal cleavage/methylation domain-containing protein
MRKTGFTLIELVMVIVIIGILAAVAIPRFMDLSTEAKRARCQSDVGAIRTGISGWYAKFWAAGGNLTNNCPSGTATDCYPGTGGNLTGLGFPNATNLVGTTTGFSKFAFSTGQLPPTSDKTNDTANDWSNDYDPINGTMDQVKACGGS